MTHRPAPLLLQLVPLFATLWGCARHPNSRFDERFDVGPEQRALITTMVGQGAALPDSCTLVDTRVERTYFQAHYACPGMRAPGTIEFRHREVAPRGSVVTAQFTLIPFGGNVIPPALLADVTARVRAHESAWRWVPRGHGEAPVTLRGPPPAADRGTPADVPTG